MSKLGRYVRVKPNTGGSPRVYFEVPSSRRPPDWPPTIPLPFSGRLAELDDAAAERIRADAAVLHAKLRQSRIAIIQDRDRTWARLVRLHQESLAWSELSSETQRTYSRYHRWIIRDFDGDPLRSPENVLESQIEAYLARWRAHPASYALIAVQFRALLAMAERERWRDPGRQMRLRAPKREKTWVGIWEQGDVDEAVDQCLANGQDVLAAFILTEWEIGQRLSDVRLFRYGREFKGYFFDFEANKNNGPVKVFITPELQELLNSRYIEGEYLFLNPRTSRPFTESELSNRLYKLRLRLADEGIERKIRQLRHSCVVHLARAGCTILEIASVTGHSLLTVHRILEHYFRRDSTCAWNAYQKRQAMRVGQGPVDLIIEGEQRIFTLDRRPRPQLTFEAADAPL